MHAVIVFDRRWNGVGEEKWQMAGIGWMRKKEEEETGEKGI